MKMVVDENMSLVLSEDRYEPCRVCGEQSSGFHCGAVTCEACKKFFIRSTKTDQAKYKCVRNRDCLIVRATRTQCQYCRFQKCKEVGMTDGENPNPNPTGTELLKTMSCHVCGASASGIHFGVITCEGCKGFFRRSIKERAPEKYKCNDNGKCQISHNTRNMCRFCRFKKCIDVGMAVKNSRVGRQSNMFKHSILEIKSRGLTFINTNNLPGIKSSYKQRAAIKIEQDPTTTTTLRATTSTSIKPEFTQPNQTAMFDLNYEQRTMQSMQETNQICINNGYQTHQQTQQIIAVNQFTTNQYIINRGESSMIGGSQIPMADNLTKISNIAPANSSVLGASHYGTTTGGYYDMNNTANTSSSWYNFNVNSNQTGQSSDFNQFNYTIPMMSSTTIMTPHNTSTNILPVTPYDQIQVFKPESQLQFEDIAKFDQKTIDIIKTVYKSYMDHMRPEILTNKSMITPLKPCYARQQALTYNGYPLANYQPLDDYQNSTFQEISAYLSFYMRQFIKFMENISEFNKLSSNDREELIRCSIHSAIVFAIYRGCDSTRVNYFNVDSAKLDKFVKLFPCFDSCNFFMKKIREKFEKHQLDDREIALYLAMISFKPSSKNLEDYESISKMREKLGTALLLYMKKRRNEDTASDDVIFTLQHFEFFNRRLRREFGNQYAFKKETRQIDDQYLFVEKLF